MDYVNANQSQRSLIPMNDINKLISTLGERIDLLETRLAYQDETIETLNKSITEQWLKIDALARQLTNLNERLQEAETRAPGAANEPPPHY
jgi:SlyX protein